MIRVVRGPIRSVYAYCRDQFNQSETGLWLEEPRGTRRAWSSVRQIVPFFRSLQNIDSVLESHKIVAALAFGGIRSTLDSGDLPAFNDLGARLHSHLSHNWVIDRRVVHGLADLLIDLIGDRKPVFFVPDACVPDPTVLPLFSVIARQKGDSAPDLVLGWDPSRSTLHTDENGIVWGVSHDQVRDKMRGLSALPGGLYYKDLEVEIAGEPNPEIRFIPDLLDDDPDGRAFESLAGISPWSSETILQGIERSFQAFGRDVALRLCVASLERLPDFSPSQQLLIHEIAGLCAHNWQFETSQGNEELIGFIEHHLRTALEHERDPRMKAALLYRLAVTLGRRKKTFPEALEIADEAVVAARGEMDPKDSLYQEIWSRNIRAYVYVKMREFKKASDDSVQCLDLARLLTTPIEDASVDFKFTRTTVADNNVTLSKFAGDETRLFEGIERNIEFLEEDPGSFGARFSAAGWLVQYRQRLKLSRAIRMAEYGLQDASREYPEFRWYYLSHLGDLHYRRGDARKALGYFLETHTLRKHLRFVESRLSLSTSLVAMRCGQSDLALTWLDEALRHPDCESPSVLAEVQSAMAKAHALLGDGDRAEKTMEDAIENALAEGIRDTMMRVALTAAEVAACLGQSEDSFEFFSQAVDLGDMPSDSPAPDGLVCAANLGVFQFSSENGLPHLGRALTCASRALPDDSEVWWSVPGLLAALVGSGENVLRFTDPEPERAGMIAVVTAARERHDCEEILDAFTRTAPQGLVGDLIEA